MDEALWRTVLSLVAIIPAASFGILWSDSTAELVSSDATGQGAQSRAPVSTSNPPNSPAFKYSGYLKHASIAKERCQTRPRRGKEQHVMHELTCQHRLSRTAGLCLPAPFSSCPETHPLDSPGGKWQVEPL